MVIYFSPPKALNDPEICVQFNVSDKKTPVGLETCGVNVKWVVAVELTAV